MDDDGSSSARSDRWDEPTPPPAEVSDLRAEIARLRAEIASLRAAGQSPGGPIRDDRGDPIFAVVITDQHRAEEALREADRRKDEFLATLSHELRNPLSAIRNSLDILDHTPRDLAPAAHRALAVIDRQVSHLGRLVDDLLDITRIARGKIQIRRQAVELNDLVHRTAEDHRATFEKNGIALSVSPAPRPLHLEADPTRLAQVIGNLLHNAAKFTPAGGRTSIMVEEDPEHHRAILRVRDTGIGMTAETLHRIFVPFMQADSARDRCPSGLGLGLSLVKGIVELHGGAVAATSDGPNLGSEIVAHLPLAAHGIAAAPEPPPRRPTGRFRILVIEDNIDAADTLRDALELREHTVEVAYDGPDGIERAKSFRPDVVLCDVGLPLMDGYAVAQALRADAALRGVRLIALSGYARAEDKARARAAGFDAHLTKPPRLADVERVLEIG